MVNAAKKRREEVRGIDTDILLADFETNTFLIQCPECLQSYEVTTLPYSKPCMICKHPLRVE